VGPVVEPQEAMGTAGYLPLRNGDEIGGLRPMLMLRTTDRRRADCDRILRYNEGMSEVEIRAATTQDFALVDALALEAWQVLKPGYDPKQWGDLLTSVGRMSQLATDGQLLVATTSGQVAGAVGYMPPGRSNPKIYPLEWPSIRMLVVRPSHRGCGIGKALMNACVREAAKDGARCIGLHTSPIMEVALPMYLRMGFIKDADLPSIAGAPYARYALTLDASRVGVEGASVQTDGVITAR
jgi:ribosomal protein S18 acetylase RimI-like enzyme